MEEFEYYTSDNTIHVVEIRGRRIINANGEPLVFVITRNITERKRAEQERIRALQDKAAFLNAMSDGLLVFNRAGTVIETILIIDDEEAVLKATTRLQAKLGYSSHATDNADDGLNALQSDPSRFSCVLLDMVMPGTNVGEILKRIYALRAEIPIMLTSGYRPEESIPSSLRTTCRWFLQKPYRAEEISKILRLAIDSK